MESDPVEPDREPPKLDEFPKVYVPPPEQRRQMHQEIRKHTDELTNLLDELDNLQDDQPIAMNRTEMQMIKVVAEIAKTSKALFEPDEKENA